MTQTVSGISIHAPLAGCDVCGRRRRADPAEFQSTHPLRGATLQNFLRLRIRAISIHAPLAGCDCLALQPAKRQVEFQSTHPLRGATGTTGTPAVRVIDFNPRTPCGVRRPRPARALTSRTFQSTHPLRGATSLSSPLSIYCATFQSTHPLRGATSEG